jgi:hypothetical protein
MPSSPPHRPGSLISRGLKPVMGLVLVLLMLLGGPVDPAAASFESVGMKITCRARV